MKLPPPPKLPPPEPPKIEMEAPKIEMPKPKPEPKPIQMEAKVALPVVKAAPKPAVILAPQPKAALTAAMPAQNNTGQALDGAGASGRDVWRDAESECHASGDDRGHRQSVWRHAGSGGCAARSGGFDWHWQWTQVRLERRASSAKWPRPAFREQPAGPAGTYGKVASAGIPAVTAAVAPRRRWHLQHRIDQPRSYFQAAGAVHREARQLKVQGDVVLRVTFLATGQVVVQGVVHGLGHGLDEEARRVAQQIRFRPATRDGQPVDLTTNITITFQLA